EPPLSRVTHPRRMRPLRCECTRPQNFGDCEGRFGVAGVEEDLRWRRWRKWRTASAIGKSERRASFDDRSREKGALFCSKSSRMTLTVLSASRGALCGSWVECTLLRATRTVREFAEAKRLSRWKAIAIASPYANTEGKKPRAMNTHEPHRTL